MVTCLVGTVFTDDERIALRAIAVELDELRKVVMELAETLVNISDKELLKSLNASQDDLKENKVLNYREKLEKQVDVADREFRS
jgi:3-methyladenine DNA glycosylase AlkD